MPSNKSTLWGTRLGFYLAAVGSAFGLGNLWRFPYIVAQNGGGAFVILYAMLAFLIGTPFLIAELSLGKSSRSSIISALMKMAGDRYQVRNLTDKRMNMPAWLKRFLPNIGKFSVTICVLVLAYYAVISGWVLHFLIGLVVSSIRGHSLDAQATLDFLFRNGWWQFILTAVHLTIVAIIVAKDLEDGLEKWLGVSVPLFGLLVIILAVRAINLEASPAALRFLFYPDFSKLNAASLGQAIGHVMFTLSIGFGSMVTFGSYLRERVSLPFAGFRVTSLDCLISLLAGIMIFPLAISSGEGGGPTLLFHAVPRLLSKIPGGQAFGIMFFLCLYLASLAASIGLLETVVANLRETRRVKRSVGAWWAVGFTLLIAIGPALSTNVLSAVHFHGFGLLELLDATLINWLLPVAALLISQVVAWLLVDNLKREEFAQDEAASNDLLYRHWIILLRYVAPPIVILALGLQVVGLIKSL